MFTRSLRFVLIAGLAAACGTPTPAPAPAPTTGLPAALTDKEFWDLSERVSEPGGQFQSDNFTSNERGYQIVIPQLLKTTKPGRAYLGVGPEQNFSYIVALKPAIAIIFDIRRGNLQEHLLYKALFELSSDRADFLSRLFSRARPAGLTASSTVKSLMAAFDQVAPSEELYRTNFQAVSDLLTRTHGFALHSDDLPGIDHVFRAGFLAGGPRVNYSVPGRAVKQATYEELMSLTDGAGLNRSFLASEENWLAMKDFETRNLLVPVVGDFAGQKAIREVGQYLKERDAVVSVFYISNVEQYLNRAHTEDTFLCNVAKLPLDDTSTFIFAGPGRYPSRGGSTGGTFATSLRPVQPDIAACGAH